MNRYEALVVTGRLEVIFAGDKKILEEVKALQEHIVNGNFVGLAITLGRLDALPKPRNKNMGKQLEDLVRYFISDDAIMEEQKTKRIEDIDWENRTYFILHKCGLKTVGDILKLDGSDLLNMKFSQKRVSEVTAAMKNLGFYEWACVTEANYKNALEFERLLEESDFGADAD